MQSQVAEGSFLLRLGTHFGVSEAEQLSDTILSLAPISQLTLDFTDVREFHDSACAPLARTLSAHRGVRIVLRGLTLHQSRLLRYFA